MKNCPNCEMPLVSVNAYCPDCGQKLPVHRLTTSHLLHDLFHSVTHADKGLLLLLKDLASRPGKVAKEFVEGKRKKYFNPFTFILLCTAFVVFINGQFKTFIPDVKADPAILKQLPDEKTREKYLTLLHRTQQVSTIVSKNPNLVYLVAIPFYALIMWLFFKRRNFAEHLVANLYFSGFFALISSSVSLLLLFFKDSIYHQYFLLLVLVLFILYQIFAYHTFLDAKTKASYIKITVATLTLIILWLSISGFLMIWYIYRSNTFIVLQKLIGS